MPIDIVNNSDDDLEAAFALIKRKLDEGYKGWSNDQKDLGIKLSFNALPDAERAWFLEVCVMLRIRFWQNLWGQYRRTKEWGMSQAPLLDPGWEEDGSGVAYLPEERECKFCHKKFMPENRGQVLCSNKCGADEERERLNAKYQAEEKTFPENVGPPPPPKRREVDREFNPARLFEGLDDKKAAVDEGESVRLEDDYAEVN